MNTPRQEMVQTLEERAEGETARRGNEPEVAWKGFPGKHSSAGPIGIVGLDQRKRRGRWPFQLGPQSRQSGGVAEFQEQLRGRSPVVWLQEAGHSLRKGRR